MSRGCSTVFPPQETFDTIASSNVVHCILSKPVYVVSKPDMFDLCAALWHFWQVIEQLSSPTSAFIADELLATVPRFAGTLSRNCHGASWEPNQQQRQSIKGQLQMMCIAFLRDPEGDVIESLYCYDLFCRRQEGPVICWTCP